MSDERTKSIRVTERTNKAAKTLAAYLDVNMDEVVARAIERLWKETFPNVPMDGINPKSKKRS
ncbi:MAG: hypothetical protein ICCCNLDF_01505 [Planctomycetes bacterium]|nr:hypothetical protein [Planctomycetota bacterium]